MAVTKLVFEIWVLKAKFKGVFSRSCCCYGNVLCHTINSTSSTDDWVVCWYHDFGINRWRQVTMTHQTLSLGKVLETVSSHLKTKLEIFCLSCFFLCPFACLFKASSSHSVGLDAARIIHYSKQRERSAVFPRCDLTNWKPRSRKLFFTKRKHLAES